MPNRSLVLAAIAASLPAFALASGLTTADATRTVTIASHITIKSKGLTFSGSVTSSNAACASGRKVLLYRKQSLVLGSTTTNSSGRWKITVSGSAGITLGHFYAKAKKRSEGTAGTIYICNAARSRTVSYRP
jgi:hypothetical protein